MPVVTRRELLEAGVHFGHQTRRWNPKMSRFLYGERSGIYIIDLEKSLQGLEETYEFVRDLGRRNGIVLFIGTKKQAQEVVAEHATSVGMPYVNNRWLGGMLTNFTTISKRLGRMRELREMERTGALDYLPKKEAIRLRREREKLERNLSGIQDLERVPDAVFIIDTKKEHIAVTEARKLGIPVIAIVDTNCDPDEVDFVIPGNDDAIRSVTLVARVIADALREGRGMAKDDLVEQMTAEAAKADEPEVETPEVAAEIAATTVFEPDPMPADAPVVTEIPEPEVAVRARSRGRDPPAAEPAAGARRGGCRRREAGMSDITAAQVKALREATGAGMMDCKNALVETGGDFERAVDLLKEKGQAGVQKRAGRSADQGLIDSYIHFNNTVGVLVEVNCETDFVANTDEFRQLVKDIALHIASPASPRFIVREEFPSDELERERHIFEVQAKESGKPEHVVEKIVEGKLNALFKDNVLLEQDFVKDDSKTVQQLLDEASAKLGEKVAVRRFVRYKLGE